MENENPFPTPKAGAPAGQNDDLSLRAALEDKYRTLFNAIDEGFCVFELIFDAQGEAVNWIYQEANPAFERQTGYHNPVGKRISYFQPNLERSWFERFAHVARTGEAARFTQYTEAMGIWYDVYALRVGAAGQNRVSLLFTDISQRKRDELRQGVLLRLSDTLRPLSDAVEIQAAVSQMAMEQFGADRCYYCEIENHTAIIRRDASRGDLPSVAGVYPLSEFPLFHKMMNGGVPLVVDDSNTTDLMDAPLKQLCVQMHILSFINVPVVKQGRYVGNLCVTQSAPRRWSDFDVAMAKEITERTWEAVERARTNAALRESEEKFRAFVSASSDAVYSMSADWQEMHFLKGRDFMADTNEPSLGWLQKYIPEEDKPHVTKVIDEAIRAKSVFALEHRILRVDNTIGWTYSRAVPILDERGEIDQWFGTATDITERKYHEQRQQFLLQLSDVLRPLADAGAIQQAALHYVSEQLNLDRLLFNEIDPGVTTYTVRASYVREGFLAYGGQQPMGPFTESVRELQQGVTKVVYDVETDESFSPEEKAICARIQVRAFVTVPLLKNGRWVLNLVAHSSKPRLWTPHELSLLEEAAERTWDAAERARAENALRDSEARLQAMAANLPGGAVFVVDRNLRYTLAEGDALRAAGFAPFDLVGKTIFEALTPNLTADYEPWFQQALAGENFTLEHDAHGTTFLSRGTPLRSENGEIYAVLVVSHDISERKRAEEALRESEDKYRTLFNSISEGFCLVEVLYDQAGNPNDLLILDTNPAQFRITGVHFPVGGRVRDAMPGFETYWIERYAEVARTGEPVRFEEWSEPTQKWYEVNASRFDKENSRKINIIFTDVTERKRRERDLAFLAEVSQDLVRLTNIDDTMNALGAKIGAYLGLSACIFGEIFGENEAQITEITHGWNRADTPSLLGTYQMREFMTLEMIQMCRRAEAIIIRDVFADPKTDGAQYAAISIGSFVGIPFVRNGEWRFLLVVYRSEPHDWSENEIELVRELMTRIWTRLERARAEEALRTSEEKFRVMVEGAQDYVMFLLDLNNRVTFWSKGAERVLGWTETEALGQNSALIFTPEDRAAGAPERERQTALESGKATDRRWHVRKNGSRFWADGLLMRLDDASGTPYGFAKVARDATDQKRGEEVVQAALEAVAQANEELEARVQERTRELAATNELRQALLKQLVTAQEEERARIARDLHDDTGQQITGLLLKLAALKSNPTVLADADALHTVVSLQGLANDVAQKSHRIALNLRPTSLDDIGLMMALQNYAEQWSSWSGLPIALDSVGMTDDDNCAKRLAPEVETTIYRVAQEALTNVLRHAVKDRDSDRDSDDGTSDGATQVSVLVQCRASDVQTIIEDDGPGFDVEAVLNRPPAERRLGLFGMQERARLAGGTLTIESEPGEGTTLYLRLPLAKG